ncbi:unnamed protein product [Trifolium pratense]|uniref:Uncharacterized protein n=1 Tax=Trifolium pratense TaxID=57577 RepID=A0ACB0L6S5_TRIPR|nr:unnamed protein product [Trifolium pratense]
MSRGVDNIKDINDKKEVWKVAVKVDDIWTTTRYSKEYAEMIIRDIQDEIVVTVAKTSHLKCTDRGWYLLGRNSCIKEAKGSEPPYECADKHSSTDPVLRYKIEVQVWDNSCIDLLGVSAGELRKNMLKDGVTDRLEYPETIDEMMGRTFAFRIKWQKEWKQGSVLECKDSKDLVGRIQKEFYDGMPINSTQTSAVNKILDVESSQVECSQSKPLEITDTLDDAPNVEEVSASADFDPLQPTTLTPSKRSPVQQKDDDVIGGQQSSTRFIKTRSTKVMKTEKP